MSANDDLRGRAARSIGWVVIERWGSRLLSLLVLAVLARLLEPEEFGIVSFATAVLAIVQVFIDAGLSRTLIQRRALGPQDASTAFWTSLGLAVLLCVLAVVSAPMIATWFDEPELTPILQVMALTLPISAFSQVPAALLERDLDFKPLSLRQLIGALSGALVAVPVALVGGGIWALVLQSVVTAAASVVALWAATPWRPRFEYSFAALRSLWRTGVAILGLDLLDAVQANVDKIIIGAFFTSAELGFYYVAQRVATILAELVTSVMSRVSLATFSRVQGDSARLDRVFRQLTFFASAVSVWVFGAAAVFAPQLVEIAFGSGWQQTVVFLWIMAPGWALGAVMYFDRNVLIATGNARPALLLALLQNAVGTALVFALVPFGVIGVAFSRLSRFLTWPVRLVVLKRAAGINVGRYLLQLSRAVAAATPVLVIIVALQFTPWANGPHAFWSFVLPCLAAGSLLYLGLLWLLVGRENRMLLGRIRSDVRKSARRGRIARR